MFALILAAATLSAPSPSAAPMSFEGALSAHAEDVWRPYDVNPRFEVLGHFDNLGTFRYHFQRDAGSVVVQKSQHAAATNYGLSLSAAAVPAQGTVSGTDVEATRALALATLPAQGQRRCDRDDGRCDRDPDTKPAVTPARFFGIHHDPTIAFVVVAVVVLVSLAVLGLVCTVAVLLVIGFIKLIGRALSWSNTSSSVSAD
jgi:hypothetical protein